MLNLGSVFVAPLRLVVVSRSVLHRSQGVFSAFWPTFCLQLLGESLHVVQVWCWLPSRSKTQLIHPDTQTNNQKNADFYMAEQVWWYCFMFQILVAIFWRVFLRHRTFISIIWSWAGQCSTQDGSKRWKKLVSFPMVFTCCVSCNQKNTLCQYIPMPGWMHFMSSRMSFVWGAIDRISTQC